MEHLQEPVTAPTSGLPTPFFLPDATWTALSRSLRLSGREAQIAQGILAGYGKEGMALSLGISDHTVQTHLERLYRKLGVGSRCEVVVHLFAAYVTLTHAPAES
jgi:DNA-binding CsgD family transcriptional regulator